MVRLLLDGGADLNIAVSQRSTLHQTAMTGNAEIAELLLAKGADFDVRDETGQPPLFDAISWRRVRLFTSHTPIDVAEVLVRRGADVNARDLHQNTPLHETIHSKCNLEALGLLLSSGADVNAVNLYGETPLHLAAYYCQPAAVKILLEHGAQVDTTDKAGRTPFSRGADCEAFTSGNDPDPRYHCEVLNRLIDAKADIASLHGAVALVRLAGRGLREAVELLLSRGVDVNAATPSGERALAAASQYGHLDVVGLLLDRGAAADAADNEGQTARDRAARNGYSQVVKLLLSKAAIGAKLEARISLYDAAAAGAVSTVQELLAAGANPNGLNQHGFAPLAAAAWCARDDIARILLAHGANVEAAGHGYTALFCVVSADFRRTNVPLAAGSAREQRLPVEAVKRTVDLLLQAGANPNAVHDNMCALSMAAVWCSESVVASLLRAGANPSMRPAHGRTALEWAIKENRLDIANLLRTSGAQE